MSRPLLAGSLLATLLALAPPAAAQEALLPEEAAERRALDHARGLAEGAWTAVERYGRGLPIPARQARQNALARLEAPLDVGPRRARRAAFDAAAERERLTAFRAAIESRLRRIDPEGHPVPDPAPEPEPVRLRLRIVDVQDLTSRPSDHPAPSVGLGVGGGGGGAGGGAGGVLTFADAPDETPCAGVDADTLIELIEQRLGDGLDEGSIEFSSGRLILRLRSDEHAAVDEVLASLRRERGGLIDLEIRVYRLPAALFGELRDGSAALDDPGEAALAEAVAGGRADLLSSHRVVAHDGQLVSVRRGDSRSVVGDLEINQTGVVPVLNPVVTVLREGLVVECRPILERRTRRVLLDVALSLSRVDDVASRRAVGEVELEQPRLEIARTSSTSTVPLGRGALLGGAFATGHPDESPLTCVVYVRPNLVRGRQ